MKVKELEKRLNDAAFAFRAALTKETDRGCALFAAAYLDRALSDLLYCALAYDKKIEYDLFKGNAPLASFSARIKMAFYLGKISRVERRDLDLIRKIRNDFAHNYDPIDFEKEDIRARCEELSFSYHDKDHRPRGHFTAACMGLLAHIQAETYKCRAPEILEDNAPTEEFKDSIREKHSG